MRTAYAEYDSLSGRTRVIRESRLRKTGAKEKIKN